MSASWRAVVVVAASAGLAVLACLFTVRFLQSKTNAPDDLHAWVHRQLELTPEQEKRLEPFETRFAERQRRLTESIRLGNRELGQAILETRGRSPRVAAALKAIEQAQAELQQATLDHVFEMKAVLRPDQYDRLLNLTADALSDGKR